MDASCCRAEPKCKDEHVCDYYNEGFGKVRLGGIYDPREADEAPEDVGSTEEDNSATDEELRRQREMDQMTQCQQKAKKFKLDFMKRTCESECNSSDTDASKSTISASKKKQVNAVTNRIVEQFGGLTLGFSGPVPTAASSLPPGQQQQQQTPTQPQGYHGLEPSPRRVKPDYPTELHMRKVCKTRPRPGRPRRIWDDEDRPDLCEQLLLASFSPKTSSSGLTELTSDEGGEPGKATATTTTVSSAPAKSTAALPGAAKPKDKPLRKRMPISADQMILKYIDKFNLAMMLEYFLALACLQGQDNPFLFISDVAGRMIRARDNEEEFHRLDRIFTNEHVQALFRLFDKEQNGFISLHQYKTAMETLGLVDYNKKPSGHEIDKITQDVFVEQAMKALDLLLRSFLKVDKS